MLRTFAALGGINAFLAVALGAFGAHGLRDRLSPEMLAIYQTGVQYHMMHALGLLLVALLCAHLRAPRLVRAAGWLLFAGIVLFSGSLYALALSGVRALGAITPLGGVAFLTGWALLVAASLRGERPGE
jgi:uncharacterized membrane protein YgdD (TMEM256/DUF423 family)